MCYVTGGRGGCGSGHSVDRGGTVGDMLTSTQEEGIIKEMFRTSSETSRSLSIKTSSEYFHTSAAKQAFIDLNAVKFSRGSVLDRQCKIGWVKHRESKMELRQQLLPFS